MIQQTFTKLSEAIRYGATLRPKTEGVYFWEEGNTLRSCAMGAAWEAITGRVEIRTEEDVNTSLSRYFHLGEQADAPYPRIPFPDGEEDYIFGVIMYMNDSLHITREQIADYLEKEGY